MAYTQPYQQNTLNIVIIMVTGRTLLSCLTQILMEYVPDYIRYKLNLYLGYNSALCCKFKNKFNFEILMHSTIRTQYYSNIVVTCSMEPL